MVDLYLDMHNIITPKTHRVQFAIFLSKKCQRNLRKRFKKFSASDNIGIKIKAAHMDDKVEKKRSSNLLTSFV